MTQWTTVSVETPTRDHYYRTEYKSWGQSQMNHPLPKEVTGTQLAKVCIIACNDKSDGAKIAYSEWDEAKDVMPHDNSLWTVERASTLGQPDKPLKDVYSKLPNWCMVRGNWRRQIY